MKIAAKSRSFGDLAAEQLNLKNGDQVAIYRKPANKDRPSWVGPATVSDITDIGYGKVTVRWQ